MTHALIYHDTHTDPEVYVGTLEECQTLCRVLAWEYLTMHPWPEHKAAAAHLFTIGSDAAAAEWAMNYCNESVEYLRCQIIETVRAADELGRNEP